MYETDPAGVLPDLSRTRSPHADPYPTRCGPLQPPARLATDEAIRNSAALRLAGSIERFLAAGEIELAERTLSALREMEAERSTRYGPMLLARLEPVILDAHEAENLAGGPGSLLVPNHPFRRARLRALSAGWNSGQQK